MALARALAVEPQVLLLDEPFGALDAKVRKELRRWLRRLHDELHVTSVFVTHDQEEALEVADRVVVMNEGRVEQVGTPARGLRAAGDAVRHAFLGNVNVFHGRVEAGRAQLGSASLPVPSGATEGAALAAYVRPSDVRLARAHEGAALTSLALVASLTRVGAYVKVDLRLPSDEEMTVQVPRAEAESMNLTAGERVLVDLGSAKIFLDDYPS